MLKFIDVCRNWPTITICEISGTKSFRNHWNYSSFSTQFMYSIQSLDVAQIGGFPRHAEMPYAVAQIAGFPRRLSAASAAFRGMRDESQGAPPLSKRIQIFLRSFEPSLFRFRMPQ